MPVHGEEYTKLGYCLIQGIPTKSNQQIIIVINILNHKHLNQLYKDLKP